ncbi:MAG: nucleotidyltransferase domain-containing protein [Mariniphaga sp.]
MKRREFILKRIVDVVEQTAPNSEVYLYGSRARGTARKMSDWDLLILLNSQEITFDFETRVMDDFYEIEIETGEVFSPMIYTKADWNTNHVLTPLFANIKREGVRLK